jgi:hypothetical protein
LQSTRDFLRCFVLQSVVLHVVDGEMTDAAIEQFAYVTRDESEGDSAPKMGMCHLHHSLYYMVNFFSSLLTHCTLTLAAFPQSPKLVWLLQNTTTSTLKERVQGKNMTAQDAEAAYMRDVLAAQQSGPNALLCNQLQTAFPDQTCFPLPDENTESFTRRMEKLARVLLESERNRYAKGAVLNGPLFESILVSMLAHRDNVFQVCFWLARDVMAGEMARTYQQVMLSRRSVAVSGRTQSTTAA